MKINEKQFNFLKNILNDFELKKNIYDLTMLEASIIIEGILNKGKVKPFHNNKKLTEDECRRKQLFFESLAQRTEERASEKQIRYVNHLASKSNCVLKTGNIPKKDIQTLINFFDKKIKNDAVFRYIDRKEINVERKLITVKEAEPERKLNLPKEWIFEDVEINGIIKF